jgi:ankyrin repeat protein
MRIRARHVFLASCSVVALACLATLAALWFQATSYDRLIAAIERGNAAAVRREIERGADVNRTTDFDVAPWTHPATGQPMGGHTITSVTPLMKAALTGDAAIVRTLIAAGADVTPATSSGGTALQMAARGSADGAAVRILLEAGADPNPTDKYGFTPLIDAAIWGRTEAARALLEGGAELLHKDRFGTDAFQYAVRHGQVETIGLLLEAGADIDSRGVSGLTALMWIARTFPGDPDAGLVGDILRVLLDAGADVNAADDDGRTPLMHAADAGSATAVRLLLEAGADPGRTDRAGQTALDIARGWLNDPGLPDLPLAVEMLERAAVP